MVKIKYDVSSSDAEKARGKDFKKPKPGVYVAKLIECKPGFKKGSDGKDDKSAPRLEVIYEITKDKEFKGARLWDYLTFTEASEWRLDQFLLAFGVTNGKTKRKGQFDTDELIGMPCRVKVKGETYNGEYSAKVAAVMEGEDEDLLDDDDDEAEDEVDSELEDEDLDEEEETEEEEEVEEEEAEEEEADGYNEADLTAMALADLNEILKEYGEEKPASVKGKSAKIARILELQPEALGIEGGGDDEEEEETEEEEDEYDEMDRAALATEARSRGLKVLKADDEDSLRAKLREDDGSDPFG